MPITQEFDPGYTKEPFKSLATTFPGAASDEYPQTDFRTEWGPIFHRGRLDGTARVLAIGQDPAQNENVLRRILVGEAGRRVQGFLKKLGITKRYVVINSLLYSVYGSNGGKYVTHPKISAYRNQWLDGILSPGHVQAVITFGEMAKAAWQAYVSAKGAPHGVTVVSLPHPTYPTAGGATGAEAAARMKAMLQAWNTQGLQALFNIVKGDVKIAELDLYGDDLSPGDLADIPSIDLPAGTPPWMYEGDGWATRAGSSAAAKRADITITVPAGVIAT
jgi:uracil-DNA glycosylase